MRAIITVSLLFLLTTAAIALTPPDIEWEVLCPGSNFNEIIQSSEGNLLLSGWDISTGEWNSIFCYSQSGDLLWEFSDILNPHPSIYVGYGLHELEDGSIVFAGTGLTEVNSLITALAIAKISSSGTRIWSKVYEFEGSRNYANDLVALPDGGFAVCGRRDPDDGMDQAIILRTDAQGDTLWTREWGWVYNDKAMSILYIDNGLTVLTHGRLQTTTGGPHLVRYDMDGNLLWETNFPDWSGPTTFAQTMCEASDGGLLLMDNYWPTIMHTDYEGNPDWWFWPPGSDQPYGYSLSTTMDGGILYGGEERGGPPGSKSICGIIARYDSMGNGLWSDHIYECDIIYSARQLSQGGYIAAGTTGAQGFLIKYAPELGFESQDLSPSLEISSISPNPFSAVTEIQFSLVETGQASLTVFDLNGRVVDVLGEGVFAEGEHTLQWAPGGIASGCYMVRLTTSGESVTVNLVLLR